jgi:hypothetical protein
VSTAGAAMSTTGMVAARTAVVALLFVNVIANKSAFAQVGDSYCSVITLVQRSHSFIEIEVDSTGKQVGTQEYRLRQTNQQVIQERLEASADDLDIRGWRAIQADSRHWLVVFLVHNRSKDTSSSRFWVSWSFEYQPDWQLVRLINEGTPLELRYAAFLASLLKAEK